MKIVVVGAGWAGCAAAYYARRAGAEVVLVEKTDLLLGTGLVGGIIRNNGRFTAAEEASELGAGDMFAVIDAVARHRNVDFPGHRHATLYDVTRIEPVVRKMLENTGVDIRFRTLVSHVTKNGNAVESVYSEGSGNISGDVFIDTTGTAGPMKNCVRYGMGCAMCVLRCPSFGPRISLAGLAGVREITAAEGGFQFEAMSGSCKLDKKSLAGTIVRELDQKGAVIIPLPQEYRKEDSLHIKVCQQYALADYATNLVLLDTGHAKLMTPFFPIESLRKIEGFGEARYADPYSGGQGNSVRFMAMAPCDDTMRVNGVENLLCAGEKTGPLVGHTEAIVTGALAGDNAVRVARGLPPRALPPELAVGDIISFMHRQMANEEGLRQKYTFSGSVYFERMKEKGMYITDISEIKRRVRRLGMTNFFC